MKKCILLLLLGLGFFSRAFAAGVSDNIETLNGTTLDSLNAQGLSQMDSAYTLTKIDDPNSVTQGLVTKYLLTETQNNITSNDYSFDYIKKDVTPQYYEYSIKSGITSKTRISNDLNGADINGHFFNQEFTSSENNYGGVLSFTDGKKVGNMTGDFINNISRAQTAGSYEDKEAKGGAIYTINDTVFGDIKGDFINNTVYAEAEEAGAKGGAIYSSTDDWLGGKHGGTFGNITGDFINNKALSSLSFGGALYLGHYSYIKSITGDFINNTASTPAMEAINERSQMSGGAVYMIMDATIDIIKGSFVNNTAKAKTTNYYARALGGAVFLATGSTISKIQGDFINNTAYAVVEESNRTTYARADGGAINNNAYLPEIQGDFIGNKALASAHTSLGSSAYAYGGAINTEDNIGVIKGAFINNMAKAEAYTPNFDYDAKAEAFGGAIYNYEDDIEMLDGDFINNSAAAYSSQDAYAYGGAVYNEKKTEIGSIKGNFVNNTAYAETIEPLDSTYYTTAAYGGAIYNHRKKSIIKSIVGDFVNNTAKAVSVSTEDTWSSGGAIYNTRDVLIYAVKGDFINNRAIALNKNAPTAEACGGALYASESVTTFIDSSFLNNGVIAAGLAIGGAIYNSSATVNIIAENKDVVFSGNFSASKENDDGTYENKISDGIYMDEYEETILNLNADSSYKIIFNDKISSADDLSTININMDGDWDSDIDEIPSDASNKLPINAPKGGTIVLNEDMSGFTGNVNLHNGTVKLGENGVFFNAASFTAGDNTTLETLNGKVQIINLPKFTLNGVLNTTLDVSLSDSTSDSLNITAKDGTGNSIFIKDLNIISDLGEFDDSTSVSVLTGAGAAGMNLTLDSTLEHLYSQKYSYDVSVNNQDLVFDKTSRIGGLAGAVADPSESTYVISSDETFTDGWIASTGNKLQGSQLVIHGNGNTLDGNANENIIVSEGNTLNINNVGTTDIDNNISGSYKNFSSQNGGAVMNNKGTVNIVDSTFTNNTATEKGGAVYNKNGVVNVAAVNSNVIFANNTANSESNAIHSDNGTLNLNAVSGRVIQFDDKLTSESNSNVININASKTDVSSAIADDRTLGAVVLNEDMSDYTGDVNLYAGTIKISANGKFFENASSFNVHGCTLDVSNGLIQPTNLGNVAIDDHLNVIVDADPAGGQMDTITANNILTDSGKINVSQIVLLSDSTVENFSLNFTDDSLKEAVTYSGGDTAYSKIYKYHTKYDTTSGNFDFTRFSPSTSDGFNPSILAAPVAAQVGSYLNQLNTYDLVFSNIDMYMLMTKEKRIAYKNANKYASDSAVLSYSPLMSEYDKKGFWLKPYSNFESVSLKNGPKVSNVSYGSLFGVDSELKTLKNGWDASGTLYAGYNGSHQAYQGIGIYQNGGLLGVSGTAYKGNFFTSLTANAGANSGEASTMYGRDNFTMLTAGIASKSGYNWEFADGKFIVQPNFQMSYSFINTFDYRNSAGVKVHSSPLNAIQVAPGIKFIGNLKNGWQPYAGITMVWNIIDETKFKANDVWLPEMSIKPYVAYGVGVQKNVGERFTGFGQVTIRNGGRTGVGFQFGLRWALGK